MKVLFRLIGPLGYCCFSFTLASADTDAIGLLEHGKITVSPPLPIEETIEGQNFDPSCAYTTSGECGNVQLDFGTNSLNNDSAIDECSHTTSEECGNVLVDVEYDLIQSKTDPCDSNDIQCGEWIPEWQQIKLLQPVEEDFCAKYYPTCVITLPGHGSFVFDTSIDEEFEQLFATFEQTEQMRRDRVEEPFEPRETPSNPQPQEMEDTKQADEEEREQPEQNRYIFDRTPLGQPLNADRSPYAVWKYSQFGGYFGPVRRDEDDRAVFHGGFDDAGPLGFLPEAEQIIRYHADVELTVKHSHETEKNGGVVVLEGFLPNGDFIEVGYIHVASRQVEVGDVVRRNTIIANGYGSGKIFESSSASAPHVHWRVSINGTRVDPLTGRQVSTLISN